MNKMSTSESDPIETGIFTFEEMKQTVKGFILAYMNKQIEIDFTASPSKNNLNTIFGDLLSEEKIKEINKRRTEFLNMLEICTGTKPATKEIREDTTRQFFRSLLVFRLNNWLNGNFYNDVLLSRLSTVEGKLKQQDKIIHGYINRLQEDAGI